jgi:non-specific serine/threonine protein kinase
MRRPSGAAVTERVASSPQQFLRVAILYLVMITVACANGGEGSVATPSRTTSIVDAWTMRAEAPLALTEVAAAAYDGRIWVAGGMDGDGRAVTAVQIYDPALDSWARGPELPEPLHHSTLVATDDTLYLVGGYMGSSFRDPTAAVRRLDPAQRAWRDGPALPSPRAAGAGAWDGQRVVYGGGVGPGGLAGDLFVLDGGSWARLAAASDGQGQVWLLGGREGSLETNLAVVDLVAGSSVRALGALPTPRGGVAAFWSAATGACLVGGERSSGTLTEVECIDAAGHLTTLPPLGVPRHGLGAAVVEGTAYVLLGGPRPGLAVSPVVEALPLT